MIKENSQAVRSKVKQKLNLFSGQIAEISKGLCLSPQELENIKRMATKISTIVESKAEKAEIQDLEKLKTNK
jgi:hypothetical protein